MRRLWVTAAMAAATALCAGTALAAVDGKAKVAGSMAEAVKALDGKAEISKAEVRGLILAGVKEMPIDPDERDLLEELAEGRAVSVDVGGAKPVKLAAAKGEAKDLAALVAHAPNLNELWGLDPAKMAKLVEMSRWGDFGRNRVGAYMINQFTPALKDSAVTNGYGPFVQLLNTVYTVFMAMPDAESREVGRALLADVAYSTVNPVDPNLAFLYAWVGQDAAKETARTGKPLPQQYKDALAAQGAAAP